MSDDGLTLGEVLRHSASLVDEIERGDLSDRDRSLACATREAWASRVYGSTHVASLADGDVLAEFDAQPLGWFHGGALLSRCATSAHDTANDGRAGAFCLERESWSLCEAVRHCSASTARARSEQELFPSSADCTVVDPRLPRARRGLPRRRSGQIRDRLAYLLTTLSLARASVEETLRVAHRTTESKDA